MVEKPKGLAPRCCGEPARWVSHTTFGYWFCDKCKEEPGNKLSTPPSWPPKAFSNLPNGYVALKGEDVVCEGCNIVVGTLNQDLPEHTHRRMVGGSIDYPPGPVIHNGPCSGSYMKYDPAVGSSKVHIKGRGWV